MKTFISLLLLLVFVITPLHVGAAITTEVEELSLTPIENVLYEGGDAMVSWNAFDKQKFNYYELILGNTRTGEKVILDEYITKNTQEVTRTIPSEMFRVLVGTSTDDVYSHFTLTLNARKRTLTNPVVVASDTIEDIFIQPKEIEDQHKITDFDIGNMNHKNEPFHVSWTFSHPAHVEVTVMCEYDQARTRLSLEQSGPETHCGSEVGTLLESEDNIRGSLNVYTDVSVKTPFSFVLTMSDDEGRVIDKRSVRAYLKP